MKKTGIILSILLVVAISCKEEKKDTSPETVTETELQTSVDMAEVSFSSGQMDRVFEEYQKLRVALVASEAGDAREAAGRLAEALGDDQAEVMTISNSIAATGELEEQRTFFSDLTAALEPFFRQNLVGGEIYQQFCPMAFEGKGGYWISDKEEIRNPYYGDRMLTCGKVTEIIKQ
jgi:hypothetical protein